jgi:uncharacterized protein (DUF849 family)
VSAVITVAPTGPIASKADNPELPTQPEEIAEAVHQAYLAGASVAHIHLRDRRDQPTAEPSIARRTMDLIAERCPILIQLSTGVGLTVPFTEREALVELRPGMATLNPCTMTFGSIGLALGGNARAGLEDTLYLRKGELSPGNLPLVRRAVELASALDRPAASVQETAALLRLPPR